MESKNMKIIPIVIFALALCLAIVSFLVPFIFVFQPALLMEGPAIDILLATGTTFIATVAVAGGLAGYMFGNLNILWRILLIVGALLVVYHPMGFTPIIGPIELTTIIGSAIVVAFVLFKFILSRLSTRQ